MPREYWKGLQWPKRGQMGVDSEVEGVEAMRRCLDVELAAPRIFDFTNTTRIEDITTILTDKN